MNLVERNIKEPPFAIARRNGSTTRSITLSAVLAATLCAMFAADTLGATYTFKPAAGNWKNASAWVDGVVPPNDGTADVCFVCTNTAGFTVTVDTTRRVNSVTITGPTAAASKQITFTGGTISIGAGGLTLDPAAHTLPVQINSAVTIETSQDWLLTTENGGSFLFYSSTTMPAEDGNGDPVVWTIAGKNAFWTHDNFRGAGIKGTVRMNRGYGTYGDRTFANQLAAPAKLVLYDTAVPIAGTSPLTLAGYAAKTTNAYNKVSSPIEFAAASADIQFSIPCHEYLAWASYDYRVTSVMTGAIGDKQLSFFGPTMIKSHDFQHQLIRLRSDASGLASSGAATPAVCLAGALFSVESANALGPGNAFNVSFSGATGGCLTGLLTTDGRNIASDFEVTPVSTFVVLGMASPGEATFSGDIATSGFASNKRASLLLEAAKGATVHFTGDFNLSGSYDYPVRVCGGGDVHLDGDNAQLTQPLRIHSARVLAGRDTALGTQAVSLGYARPSSATAKAVNNIGWNYLAGTWQKYKFTATNNANTNYTYTGTLPALDNVAVGVGDTFLHAPAHEAGNMRIWRVLESNKIALEQQHAYTEGSTVTIDQGYFYGGATFRYLATNFAIPDVADPDVALLAKGGRTIANGIDVAANGSAGASTIGCADATVNTFAGAIVIHRGVTFHAPAGGVVRLTGSITDAGENLNAFAFSGTGTVELPGGTDMNGRVASFPGLTDEALDATGQTSCTLVSASGGLNLADIAQPSLSKWRLRVKPDRIRASKVVGTKVMIQ